AADAETVADGILSLEQNCQGPLQENPQVPATLELWQKLEQAHPKLQDNWRWQMLLVRAYYDAYQQARLIRETELEREAYAELEQKPGRFPTTAIQAARQILSRVETDPTRPELRKRIVELFDDLFQSIKLQTSVEKHHAIHPQRGCMLDFLDYPLNNRFW